MSQPQPEPMPSARRRMPGMTSQGRAPEPSVAIEASTAAAAASMATPVADPAPKAAAAASASEMPAAAARPVASPPPAAARRRRPVSEEPAADERRSEHGRARDYATTRLVNFRIPVDLHDRFKQILRAVEDEHPRLRKPSLTELLIGLLEEGPQTADQVAGVIRRKRAAEHAEAES
jgi:hypothetical protein